MNWLAPTRGRKLGDTLHAGVPSLGGMTKGDVSLGRYDKQVRELRLVVFGKDKVWQEESEQVFGRD